MICSNTLRSAASASAQAAVASDWPRRVPGPTETPSCHVRYILGVRFEKIWVEQCRASKAIKRRFGAKSALDYLIGEKPVGLRIMLVCCFSAPEAAVAFMNSPQAGSAAMAARRLARSARLS